MKRQENNTTSFRLPHSEEAETAVLGMLLCESTAINEVNTLLTPEVFYSPKHSAIYEAVEKISLRGDRPDMVMVLNELIKTDRLNEIGGATAIAELTTGVTSAINVFEHASYLHQLYIARQLAIAGQMITAAALDLSRDVDDVLTESLQRIEEIAAATCKNSNTFDLSHSAHESLTMYQNRKENAKNGIKTGISTGLSKIDNTLRQLRGQQLVILAARPAMGKTAFLLNIAISAAKQGVPVLIFSLEMSNTALADRLILSESRLNGEMYQRAYLNEAEERQLCDSVDYLSALPITIDDTANISINRIKTRAKNLQRKGKCGLVLIDYLQLIDMRSGNKSYNREQEVSQVSRSAKLMAKELNIPVVMLSQLSRKNEDRADKTPLLSDLRESGAIEQDADIVLFLHREEYYNKSAEKGVGIIRIAKQRDGKTGDIQFRYNENMTRFSDYDSTIPF